MKNWFFLFVFISFSTSTHAQVLQNFTLEGRYFYEGEVTGADMIGDTLYVNAGDFFEIFDLSNLQNPIKLGTLEIDSTFGRMYELNRHIIAIDKEAGLNVINVDDCLNPRIAYSRTDLGLRGGAAADGGHLFAVCPDGFYIFGLNGQDSLIVLGRYLSQQNGFESIYVNGNMAVISRRWGHTYFEIVNISNPANPQIINSYFDLDRPGLLAISTRGNYLYFGGCGTNLGYAPGPIYSYDISDPIHPRLADSTIETNFINDLIADDTLLYAACDLNGLRIYKLNDSGGIDLIGHTTLPTTSRYLSKNGNTIISSDLYYGANLIDVSDPASPEVIFNHDVSGPATGVCAEGNYLYVVEHYDSLRIFDISSTILPTQQISVCSARYSDNLFKYGNLLVGVNLAYWSGFNLFDVSNAAAPSMIYHSSNSDIISHPVIRGNYLYTPFWTDLADAGLRIYDISDPRHPSTTTFSDPYNSFAGYDIAFIDSFAYMTDAFSLSPFILNTSDPMHITQIDGMSNRCGLVRIIGEKLFMGPNPTYPRGEIKIFDIRNPLQPLLEHTIPASVPNTGFKEIINGCVYMGQFFGNRFEILDIGGFTVPESLGAFALSPTLGMTWLNPQFEVHGRTVYCTGGDKGLYVLRYTGPMPINTGDANASGDLNGLDVLYLVSYLKGMGPAPSNPQERGDANGDCAVNGLDVLYLVNYFKGFGQEPIRGFCYGH